MSKKNSMKYIRVYWTDTFLGEPVEKWYYKYRFNEKITQKFNDDSQGGWWQTLSEEETKILKSKIIQDGDDFKLIKEER